MRRSLLLALLLSSLPQPVDANPVAMEVLVVRQVPHTQHVQVTYGAIESVFTTPTGATRDDQALSPSWTTMSTLYQTNTGSGVTGVSATQFCDCAVPVGEHTWAVTVSFQGEHTVTRGLTVVANLEDQRDAGDVADAEPWDIPDPVEFQGLDCAAACEAAPPADGGSPPPRERSGCSLAGTAAAGSFGLLALGLLVLLLRRRAR